MVDTAPVWGMLFNLTIGQVVAWIAVIAAIIAGIVAATIKLYKAFSKVKALKDADTDKTETLKKHDEMMDKICDRLDGIQKALDEQKDVNLKQIRYQIVHTCDDALDAGFITAGKLKSLEELFEEYTEIFHGNGYVKTMMKKTRCLDVRGKLDE